MRRGSGNSYWMASAPSPGVAHPPLDGDRSADVVVVGAGVAGVCTARELVRAGADVVLLEADRIAAGVTGHAAGELTSLHGLCYAHLRRRRGPEAAALYADAQEGALRQVERDCAELGVDAEIEHRPAFTYTADEGSTAEIHEEADAAEEAGLRATTVTDAGLPYPVVAAVRVEDQLQFHPRRYLLGLADDFVAQGGRLHEGTRVTELHDGAECRLTVEGGAAVHARDVVLATHFPLRCHSSLLVRLSVRRELVVAASVDERHAPYGMYVTFDDGARSVRTAPLGEGRRLLIVAGEAFEPGSGGVPERYASLEAWARGHLPGFAEAAETHRWAAQDVHTPDGMPCVGHEHPDTQHVYLATGFGGWGLSNGVAAGRLLAAHMTGAPRPAWTELVDPRRHLPVREVPGVVRQQSTVARHYVAGWRTARRCTHMGCELGFNEAEQTWECPCHGSRFVADGSVLQGPATRALAED
ncbi:MULTISPECIES: FAD-dependent oxidoreductase [unclassified Streptomyces]|uniref:FAD-dependent oxidoreductase n=1 Tax=unclassified Streptomyces TaxID=2593676 RepID=UPI001654FFBC|nr:FAD-dependent oxidoreductase [Streptomyces sp. CB02980]MCB8904533.1 FAD-dependent oxidoreductase [Streptomyces sp. CB02980]